MNGYGRKLFMRYTELRLSVCEVFADDVPDGRLVSGDGEILLPEKNYPMLTPAEYDCIDLPRSEKRTDSRRSTGPLPVKIYGASHRLYGYARDISRTGMQIRTFLFSSTPKAAGERISLELSLPGLGPDIGINAEVVWNDRPPYYPDTLNWQGVRFLDITPALQGRLGEWVGERTSLTHGR